MHSAPSLAKPDCLTTDGGTCPLEGTLMTHVKNYPVVPYTSSFCCKWENKQEVLTVLKSYQKHLSEV